MAKAKRTPPVCSSSLAGPLSAGSAQVQMLQPSTGPAAAAFDPAVTLIRMPELLALTGLQRATVYKRLKDDPTFPRPVPLSNSTARGAPVAFVLAEVTSWINSRIAARGKVAA